MKLKDWIAVAALLILAIGVIVPRVQERNSGFSTTVVGIVLIIIGLVAGSETLKKGEPEPSKKHRKGVIAEARSIVHK